MVSHCACPTRVFRDRALHEHRRPSSLPSHAPFQADLSTSPQGGLVDLRMRASNVINAPSKLAHYLFRDEG